MIGDIIERLEVILANHVTTWNEVSLVTPFRNTACFYHYLEVKVTNKAQKKISDGIRTHDLHDTGAMLYQLSYEASPEADQV